MIKIAIIDDGLTCLNNNIKICNQYKCINNTILSIDVSHKIKSNHGSICAAIIAEDPIEFFSIQIIQNGIAASIESLKTAIEFASTLEVSIIHISLGSYYWIDGYYISEAVKNAVSVGKIIVGSISSDGRRTFPGSFSNVIGVCNASITDHEFVCCQPNLYNIDVFADLKDATINTSIGPILIPKKSSYAAALVTRKLCEWLENENRNSTENDLTHFFQFIDNAYNSEKQNECKSSMLQKMLLRRIDIFQSIKFSQISDEAKIVAYVGSVEEAIESANMYGNAVALSRNTIMNSLFGVDDCIANQDIKRIAKLYCSNQIIELR